MGAVLTVAGDTRSPQLGVIVVAGGSSTRMEGVDKIFCFIQSVMWLKFMLAQNLVQPDFLDPLGRLLYYATGVTIADVNGLSSSAYENFIHGAPIFAPLLFANLAILAGIGIWDLLAHQSISGVSTSSM